MNVTIRSSLYAARPMQRSLDPERVLAPGAIHSGAKFGRVNHPADESLRERHHDAQAINVWNPPPENIGTGETEMASGDLPSNNNSPRGSTAYTIGTAVGGMLTGAALGTVIGYFFPSLGMRTMAGLGAIWGFVGSGFPDARKRGPKRN